MDIGTQIVILVVWSIFSAIVTKINKENGKILWLIGLGIFSIFATIDIINAINILPTSLS